MGQISDAYVRYTCGRCQHRNRSGDDPECSIGKREAGAWAATIWERCPNWVRDRTVNVSRVGLDNAIDAELQQYQQ